MSSYRDELAAVRAQKELLEEQLREQERELERRRVQVDSLEARLHGARAGEVEPGTLVAAERNRSSPRATHTREAALEVRLEPRTLRPSTPGGIGASLLIFAIFAANSFWLCNSEPDPKGKVAGWGSLLFGVPLSLWALYRLVLVDRYMMFTPAGLSVRGFGKLKRSFAWSEIEATRVVALPRSGTSLASIKSRRDGEWHNLETGYLRSGEEVADLIDRWRIHDEACRALLRRDEL